MIDPAALGLETYHARGDEVQVLCPFHDDHKPSASFNVRKAVFYCYACGASMNAKAIAKELGGEIVQLTSISSLERRKDAREWRPLLYSPQATDHPYLKHRRVTNGQITKYDIKELRNGIGFPLTGRHGELCGLQERQIGSHTTNGRYILHGEKSPVWPFGISFISELRPLLVEGIFGVLRLERAGYHAYATLSSQITSRTAHYLNGRRPIVWFDNDYAGRVGAAKLVLSCNASVLLVPKPPDEVDSKRDAKSIISKAERTRDLEELAERSGDPNRFWKHISLWRQKYSFSSLNA